MAFDSKDPFIHSSFLIYQALSELKNPFVFHEDENQWALKSGVENPYFNFLVLKESSDSSFEKAKNFFDSLPFECTFNSRDKDLIDKCVNSEFIFGEDITGFVLDFEDFNDEFAPHKDIVIQRVNSDSLIKNWNNVVALCFGLSKNYVKSFFYPLYASGHPQFNFSLGFLNGLPATASLIFVNPPVSSIFCLATLPRFRNKGITSSLLQEELSLARMKKALTCTVQASFLGKTIYKKLGFKKEKELATYIYLPKMT